MPANTTPPSRLIHLIEAQQAALGLTDQDLCTAIGLERQVILMLMKAGGMKVPLTLVPALASALRLDPTELLRTALAEHSPELLAIIESVYNPLHLNSAEVGLIQYLRTHLAAPPDSPKALTMGMGVTA